MKNLCVYLNREAGHDDITVGSDDGDPVQLDVPGGLLHAAPDHRHPAHPQLQLLALGHHTPLIPAHTKTGLPCRKYIFARIQNVFSSCVGSQLHIQLPPPSSDWWQSPVPLQLGDKDMKCIQESSLVTL